MSLGLKLGRLNRGLGIHDGLLPSCLDLLEAKEERKDSWRNGKIDALSYPSVLEIWVGPSFYLSFLPGPCLGGSQRVCPLKRDRLLQSVWTWCFACHAQSQMTLRTWTPAAIDLDVKIKLSSVASAIKAFALMIQIGLPGPESQSVAQGPGASWPRQ